MYGLGATVSSYNNTLSWDVYDRTDDTDFGLREAWAKI